MAPLSQLSQQQQPDLSIPKFFARLQDPRRAHRRLHRLQDIIVIALCAVIAGAQDWQQIETFGRKRRAWLSGFLELLNGIPSHDITAIPALLELLDLNGALVTIDAMGCQKAIAQKVVDQGGHYALTVKDNQEHLLADIQQAFTKAFDTDFAEVDHDV